jgi:hypothetical protein
MFAAKHLDKIASDQIWGAPCVLCLSPNVSTPLQRRATNLSRDGDWVSASVLCLLTNISTFLSIDATEFASRSSLSQRVCTMFGEQHLDNTVT